MAPFNQMKKFKNLVDGIPLGNQIRINKESGRAFVSGVDYGPRLFAIAWNKQCVVLKAGGHQAWCGRGQTKYYPTKIHIWSVTNYTEDKEKVTITGSQLLSYTTR